MALEFECHQDTVSSHVKALDHIPYRTCLQYSPWNLSGLKANNIRNPQLNDPLSLKGFNKMGKGADNVVDQEAQMHLMA